MRDYGNGKSTGLDQTAAGKISTGLSREDLAMSAEDRQVLRVLAEQVQMLGRAEDYAHAVRVVPRAVDDRHRLRNR